MNFRFGAAVNRLGGSEQYFILLIVTDGCVTNPQKTLDAIVKCSFLPVSIIILGVGQRDYSPMQKLLSCSLKSSDGEALQRDVVTFAHFTENMTESELLAKLLENVPRQFICWANLSGKFPGEKAKL